MKNIYVIRDYSAGSENNYYYFKLQTATQAARYILERLTTREKHGRIIAIDTYRINIPRTDKRPAAEIVTAIYNGDIPGTDPEIFCNDANYTRVIYDSNATKSKT